MGGPFSSIKLLPFSTRRHHHRRRHRQPFLDAAGAAAALLFLASATLAAAGSGLTTEREVKKRFYELQIWQRSSSSCGWCRSWARRRLLGPGSSPPTCKSKCGRCSPCKPVHVPIQPGRDIPLEYYPEAWRCKCGNKLFMP